MFKKVLISMAPVALLGLMTVPAAAQPALPNLEIRIAHSAPPRVRVERIPKRPDRQSVWARGYWNWEGSRWDWVPGRWNRAENNRRSRWVAPRYRRDGKVWRYEPPHWSHERVVEGDEYHRWKAERHPG
jgi:hypothetical protein